MASLLLSARNHMIAFGVAFVLLMSAMFVAAPQAFAGDSGVNVALASAGGRATSSANEMSDKWLPEKIIDGDTSGSNSRWSSNEADDAWVQVQLSQPTVIDHVNIYWETACSPEYKVQVSTDGHDWRDAASVDRSAECVDQNEHGTNAQKVTSTLDASLREQEWQYVRMQGNGRVVFGQKKWGMSLYELEVWNGSEPVPSPTDDGLDLIPLPVSLTEHPDQLPFELTANTSISADAASADVAKLFAQQMRASTGFALPIETGGTINLSVDANLDVTGIDSHFLDEAYFLEVANDGVTITGRSAHGVWNGTRTFMQLLPSFIYSDTKVNADWKAPAVTIKDAPRFSYRSMQLDPSRSFLTVDEIKDFIDTWANVKGSSLHWHLSDDQGWRIEITNEGREPGDTIDYTLLTAKGGVTAMNGNKTEGKFGSGAATGTYLPISGSELDEIGHTGYYTQQEFMEVQEYAKARFVNIVPEIDMPAHTMAALSAIPQLNSPGSSHDGTLCTDECGENPQKIADPAQWITAAPQPNGDVGKSYLDPNSEWTNYFMNHVFKQLADITQGDYIHVGGDESHDMTAAHGIEYFNSYLTKSTKAVRDAGKTPMGWNEIASNTLQAGDVVQYWTGNTANTVRAATQDGAKVVVSAASNSYLDMHYGAPGGNILGLTWAGTGDFDKYYDWNPARVAAGVPESAVIGTDAPQWSETIRGGYQAEWLAWPRAISHAEVGWTPQAQRNVNDFKMRMSGMGDRLTAMGVNFYDGAKAAWDAALVGTDTVAAPGVEMTLPIGKLAAPGTSVSADGSSVSVVGGGRSASALADAFSATVEWGDGGAAEAVTFGQFEENPQGGLYRTGVYTVLGTHTYANAGTYHGTITGADGRTARFTVDVAAGTSAPRYESVGSVASTPSITLAKTNDIHPPERVELRLAGFNPNEYVKISWGGDELFLALTDVNGEATYSMPFVTSMRTGEQILRAESAVGNQGESVAADSVKSAETTATLVGGKFGTPLANPIDRNAYTVAAVSSDTSQEPSPSGLATAAIDGDAGTYWHTDWDDTNYPMPHFITVKLDQPYYVSGLEYTSRQTQANGRAKAFKVYVSDTTPTLTKDSLAALASGEERAAAIREAMNDGGFGKLADCGVFDDTREPLAVNFEAVHGEYVTLVETSSMAGNGYGGAAEVRIGGTLEAPVVPEPDPGEPDVPGPGTPEVPDNPDTPGDPDTPDTPGSSEQPDTPDVPVEPDNPDVPATPGTSEGQIRVTAGAQSNVAAGAEDPVSCTVSPWAKVVNVRGVSYMVSVDGKPAVPDARGIYHYGYGQTLRIKASALAGYQLTPGTQTQWAWTAPTRAQLQCDVEAAQPQMVQRATVAHTGTHTAWTIVTSLVLLVGGALFLSCRRRDGM
ncbi:MAG: family 20 glycosylhydrolase [Actinomycetaceae bacterium]|nr:family 20 glycosylhydrolase [Actinomycetaceae bacterium]MDY5272579.1 family 20 glycosylhydrolase [Arcanobacterium sp.]